MTDVFAPPTRKTIDFDAYIEQTTSTTYIQEFFVDEPCTQECAVDMIISNFPLPANITRGELEKWVEDEVIGYNDQVDPEYPDQLLPSKSECVS